MYTTTDDINEAIERVCDELESSSQTEALALVDHLHSLQAMAEEEGLSREDFMELIQSSLQELLRLTRQTCIAVCGVCNEEDTQ